MSVDHSIVMASPSSSNYVVPWKRCDLCSLGPGGPGQMSSKIVDSVPFKSPHEFGRHLRDYHCTREGGSFVCLYGPNGVCPSLPLDGVSEWDYQDHVMKDHVSVSNLDLSQPTPPPIERRKSISNSQSSSGSPALYEPNSTAPSVVQNQLKWTIYMSRVNLPAALNDPRLLRRETNFFTKTWGESFDKTDIPSSPFVPHITKEHFKAYLSKTSKRYQKHVRSTNSNSLDAENPPDTAQVQKLNKFRAEVDVIPKIFYQPGFSLQDLDTFNSVFPWSQIEESRQNHQDKSRQSAKLLQEKLSHYLDLVEVQITKQISTRSEAFFSAMISHDELQEYMKKTCATIQYLRGEVHHLDHVLVENPFRIIQMTTTRMNYVKVYNKLKLMATVHQTQPTIQLLLATNEFVGALDLITTTQEVLTQELLGIQCFRHLSSQLNEMEKLIDRMMQEEFTRFATAHLNQPVSEINCRIDEERLILIVLGSLHQHKYDFIEIFSTEASDAIRAVVKQTVIEAVVTADDVESDSAAVGLANQMRLLNYGQWMILLKTLFANLLVILNRVVMISEIISSITKAVAEHASFPSTPERTSSLENYSVHESLGVDEPSWKQVVKQVVGDTDQILSHGEYLHVTHLVREMLCHVNDHAHDRCLKIIGARAKDNFFERLTTNEFVLLSRCVEGFVADTEKVCGRRSTSLRASLQSQSSKFVGRFHEERKNKLSLILDNERWKQADVPAEFQELVDHISSSGKLLLPTKKSETENKLQEYLFVDGQKFAVVGTVLMLLKMIIEYCQFVDDIPSAAAEVLNRLVELLKTFNSRTCQLILGAGALHLVGLKTISTKNLGLASRCLQLILYYLPLIKDHFEQRLQTKQQNMLKHFEHLSKDYNDHISEISVKLVSIMDAMLQGTLTKYEVKAPMPSACFRNILKQITKLHEAISDLLPLQQIQGLFEQLHLNFKSIFRLQLIKLGVNKDGGPQHGLVLSDIAFYTNGMRALPGFTDFDFGVDDIWEKR